MKRESNASVPHAEFTFIYVWPVQAEQLIPSFQGPLPADPRKWNTESYVIGHPSGSARSGSLRPVQSSENKTPLCRTSGLLSHSDAWVPLHPSPLNLTAYMLVTYSSGSKCCASITLCGLPIFPEPATACQQHHSLKLQIFQLHTSTHANQ